MFWVMEAMVIRLSANRLDVYDTFQFRIEASGSEPAITGDADAAAEMLLGLGVPDPVRLVRHVRHWGSLEIFSAPARNSPARSH